MTSGFNHQMIYACEKFGVAIQGLATDHRALRLRLPDAWRFHLTHVRRENMPDDQSWARLEKLRKHFSRVQDPHFGSAVASMRNLRNSTLEKLADEIFDLYSEVNRAMAEEQRLFQ